MNDPTATLAVLVSLSSRDVVIPVASLSSWVVQESLLDAQDILHLLDALEPLFIGKEVWRKGLRYVIVEILLAATGLDYMARCRLADPGQLQEAVAP